jgi:putative ABC transport system permease protein
MTGVKLILRSLRFYWRTHLGVTLGAAAATAVLVGALLVGDSVKGSLRDLALLRLGNVHLAMSSQERFFRAQLADDLALALGAPAAPLLQFRGIAASSDGSSRADEVRVLGVDERFWALGGGRAMFNPPATAPGQPGDEVILNEPLARQLGAVAGDEIVLRVGKPSLLPAEAPMSLEASAVAFRLRVARIATAGDFGDFSLQANQVVPPNAFVRLSWLQGKLARPGRANLLLVGPGARGGPALEQAQAALRKVWQLADGGLELAELPQRGAIELRSDRVFLAPAVAAAALEAGSSGRGVLTYFVNEVRLGDRSTPYSMVCGMDEVSNSGNAARPPSGAEETDRRKPVTQPMAAGPGVQGLELQDDEIIVNSWLAEDLAAKVGDVVEVTYFVLGPSGSLKEQARKFRVRAVAPLEGAAADPTLMPAFPGIAEAENCRDWQGEIGRAHV